MAKEFSKEAQLITRLTSKASETSATIYGMSQSSPRDLDCPSSEYDKGTETELKAQEIKTAK